MIVQTTRQYLDVPRGQTVTLFNFGDTLYVGDQTVSAGVNESTVLNGGTVALTAGRYLVSAGWSRVEEDITPQPAATAGQLLVAAATPDGLVTGAITRDTNGAATSANVVWPDGATGVYTATTVSTAFPGAVDAYTVTHTLAGITTTTYTQPTMTRDATTGAVTSRPTITVA